MVLQNLPGKMIDHFGWFHHFLKPIHHFTGASFFRVKLLLFGSPSFYRNIILLEQLCPPNLSPSFYDSTLKNSNIVQHFTGSLLLHWNYRNEQFFLLTKPVGGGLNVCFPLGNRHCSTTSIIFLNSSPKLHVQYMCIRTWLKYRQNYNIFPNILWEYAGSVLRRPFVSISVQRFIFFCFGRVG